MGDITNNLIDTIKELTRRIRSLELSVFTYGEQPDSPPSEAAITGLNSSVVYYTEPTTLLPRATATFNWTKPNTPDDPVVSYYVSVTRTGDAGTGGFVNVGDVNSYVVAGLPVDTNVTFRIYGITRAGVVGPTATHARTITRQTTAPLQPATPGVDGALRGIRVSNNGLSSTGGAMSADLAYYEVHAVNNGTTTFTPTATTLWGKMGPNESVYITANASYQNIAVRLVAVNTTGVKSTPSTGVIGTPLKVNDTDSGITLPTGAAYSDVNNLIIDGSNESASIRALRNATLPANFTSANDLGGAKHGSWFWKSNNAINPATVRAMFITGSSVMDNSPITAVQVSPNTKLFLGFQVRNIGVNAGGTVRVFCRTTNIDPVTGALTYEYPGITITAEGTSSGDWEQQQVIITTSDYTAYVALYVSVRDTCTSGEWYFDAFELRQVLSTVLIEDGAITRAKIGDAAIGTAQIEEIDAGLIKSGIIGANLIGSNSIKTRHLEAGAVDPSVISDDLGAALDIQSNPALSDMASKTIVEGIANDLSGLNGEVTSLTNAVKIDAAGVTIKDVSNTSNPASVVLNAEGLNLYEGTARVAYINGQVMYIRSAEITDQLKIGVHIIEQYDANNTFIRWVG